MGQPTDVELPALHSAAGGFDGHYSSLCDAIRAFDGRALQVDGAFGWLGPSLEVLRQYERSTEQAMSALDKVATLLSDAARGLRLTAANYAAADQASNVGG